MGFARYGQNILMLHERMSRILVGSRLPSKQAEPVVHALRAALEPLPGPLRQTLTFDNGTEFARHYELHQADGIATYFCDPHAPWQKGGIENAIGRMRRYLPRKTDLAQIEDDLFTATILRYNNTPRKCLGWKTPAEAFSNHLLHFKRESHPPAFAGMTSGVGRLRGWIVGALAAPCPRCALPRKQESMERPAGVEAPVGSLSLSQG